MLTTSLPIREEQAEVLLFVGRLRRVDKHWRCHGNASPTMPGSLVLLFYLTRGELPQEINLVWVFKVARRDCIPTCTLRSTNSSIQM